MQGGAYYLCQCRQIIIIYYRKSKLQDSKYITNSTCDMSLPQDITKVIYSVKVTINVSRKLPQCVLNTTTPTYQN